MIKEDEPNSFSVIEICTSKRHVSLVNEQKRVQSNVWDNTRNRLLRSAQLKYQYTL